MGSHELLSAQSEKREKLGIRLYMRLSAQSKKKNKQQQVHTCIAEHILVCNKTEVAPHQSEVFRPFYCPKIWTV